MRASWSVLGLLLIAGCAKSPLGNNAEATPPLPKPPIAPQVAPWIPPKTTATREFVDATAFLLANGMADPRGGHFAEAKVVIGNLWGQETAPVPVHGWYFKDRNEIVALNGLRYPIVEFVKNLDLTQEKLGSPSPSSRVSGAIAPALVLVSGNIELAEKLAPKQTQPHPFDAMATAYLSARFDRAVTAHMRGDDAVALADAQELRRVRPAFEAKAAEGLSADEIKRRTEYAYPPVTKDSILFPFLAPIDALAEDANRRLNRTAVVRKDPATIKDQAERIRVLIDSLEDVNARQFAQPGGVNLAWDSRVIALVKEGEPAIEPLLAAIDKDRRLTRSVSFGRDFFPPRHLITVADAAFASVHTILGVDSMPDLKGKSVTSYLREFWKSTKGLTQPERWMHVLSDDNADSRQWMDAVTHLFDRQDVQRSGYSTTQQPRQPGQALPPVKAEVLRSKSGPSLTELLVKRSEGFLKGESPGTFDLLYSLQLANTLYRWDPKAALPTLQSVTRRVEQLSQRPNGNGNLDYCSPELGLAVNARADLGDGSALTEWAEWIKTVDAIGGHDRGKSLVPILARPKDPFMAKTAKELFRGQGSKWNLVSLARKQPGSMQPFFLSPLIGLAPVRESLDDVLQDQAPAGEAWLDGKMMYIKHDNGTSGSQAPVDPAKDHDAPKSSAHQPIRVADYVATTLSGFKGIPKFAPYWPKRSRDKALADIRTYFRSHTDPDDILPWPYNGKESP